MRELLPETVPGKTLEQCTAAELIALIVCRHGERAVQESHLGDTFVSDGTSLQEWIYGSVRVIVGINPNDSVHLLEMETVERTSEMVFFEAVMEQLGHLFKRHVKKTYDAFVHLPNELALSADGHRPVNDRFRNMADEQIKRTAVELGIPLHVVGGTIPERLNRIVEIFGLTPVMSTDEAIARAHEEYQAIDMTTEFDRASVLVR